MSRLLPPDATPLRIDNRSPLVYAGKYSMALTHLSLLAASGLTQLVASTHATIASVPPLQGESGHPEQAPASYQMVNRSLLWLAALAQQLSAHLPREGGGLFRSALNGVLGNTLIAHDSPLQQGMSLRNEQGKPLTADRWQDTATRGLVLFVHGLCLSEREWQNEAHPHFVQALREAGYGVAWLRYNTGRAIHENGTDLSHLLDHSNPDGLPITLIGHSMGGLVIRAACHQAKQQGLPWLAHLQNAAYLGCPHQGSPLERVGESANRLLGLTAYTRPLMQIGGVRSNGIQDLRHGRIAVGERPVTLVDGVRHLLVAGHLGQERWMSFLGDGLVPVNSALGRHPEPEKALHGEQITRLQLPALGHMALLRDERVYAILRDWLQVGATTSPSIVG